MSPPVLWIGVVEMKPLNRAAYGATGAFTNIITWACDMESFRVKAEALAATVDQCVIGVEEAEPLSERRQKFSLSEELEELALRAEANPNAILFGTFHTYPFEEA
jgi:hypothetical protein